MATNSSYLNLNDASRPLGLGFWSLHIPSMRVVLSQKVADDWSIELESFAETMDQSIDRIFAEDQAKVRAAFKAALDRTEDYCVEYRVARPQGDFLWIEARGELVLDEKGEPYRLMGTIHDITSRKNAEFVIQASEARFRLLADFIPQIVWTSDGLGNIDYYNKKWFEYTGSLLNDDLPNGWVQFIHPDDLLKATNTWKECQTQEKPFEMELRLKQASDGSYRWHLSRCLPLRDQKGKIIKWLGTNTDIHEYKDLREEMKKATQKAQQAGDAKTAFLANMSHEIRTPLAAILGFTQLLSKNNATEEERKNYFQIVERNGKALTRIIDDILDISKIEAGRLDIERIDFRLDYLLDEVLDVFQEAVKEKNLEIETTILPGTPIAINTDRARLRQILVNIVGNAVKFTAEGMIRITISSKMKSEDLCTLTISVQDSGIGLSAEQVKSLFKPFSQADTSTTRKYGGTGLGLILSRRFARALGGNVSLKAHTPGDGCTFVIRIIAGLARDETLQVLATPEVERKYPELPHSSENLIGLLADDAPENRLLLNEVLTRCGFRIDLAHDGAEAIQKAQHFDYDFILMDMQMPVVDGYEATRRIRKMGYTKPIIALTASALETEKVTILASGCDERMTKPFDFRSLILTISRLTKRA